MNDELPKCFMCHAPIFGNVDASFEKPVHVSRLTCINVLKDKNTELRAEIERLKAEINSRRIPSQEYPKLIDLHAWVAENDPGIVVRFGDIEPNDSDNIRCSE